MPGLWAIFTVVAAAGQVLRNAQQKELTASLGTVGATHVRFLFGLPFGLLFLALVLAATGLPLPQLNGTMLAWTVAAALAQIGATALLLAAMRDRSFVVITAYAKTEAMQVAVFGLLFLGDRVTLAPCRGHRHRHHRRAAGVVAAQHRRGGLHLEAGGCSASARAPCSPSPRSAFAAASARSTRRASSWAPPTTLALGLLIQTVLLSAYLFVFDRKTLFAIFRLWRPSLLAGFTGAFASQMWFLAFALETAAKVRTLALIEIPMAQVLSRNLFKQTLASREALGIG